MYSVFISLACGHEHTDNEQITPPAGPSPCGISLQSLSFSLSRLKQIHKDPEILCGYYIYTFTTALKSPHIERVIGWRHQVGRRNHYDKEKMMETLVDTSCGKHQAPVRTDPGSLIRILHEHKHHNDSAGIEYLNWVSHCGCSKESLNENSS